VQIIGTFLTKYKKEEPRKAVEEIHIGEKLIITSKIIMYEMYISSIYELVRECDSITINKIL
jgi:hypothetical protein